MTCGLVHRNKFQLAHIDFDVVLAHAQKATNANHDAFDFAGLVDEQFADVAKLFIVLVINIEPFELRRTPYIASHLGRLISCGRCRQTFVPRRGIRTRWCTAAPSHSHAGGTIGATFELNWCANEQETEMPIILWLLGVPLGLVVVLWLLHVV